MVTIVIPTYKRTKYIKRAINSVLNQTYSDIELIVVDDNDPDTIDRKNMEQIMEHYKNNSKVKYIKHSKNMKGPAARNTGIEHANGEYISFLDDDDIYLSTRIEELVDCLNNNPDFDAAYTNSLFINKNKIVKAFKATLEGNLQFEILTAQPIIKTGSNLFFRTEVLKELNGFDIDFFRFEDLEILVRFFRTHKIKALDTYTVVKDVSPRITFSNLDIAIQMRELFLEKYKNDIEKYENKNLVYISQYKKILSFCDDKNDKYQYILDKLKQYNYKPNIFEVLKNKIRKNRIKNFLSYLKFSYKLSRIDHKYKKELKYFLRKYNI